MKKNNDTKDRVFIPKTIGESLKKVNKKFSNQFGKIEYLIHSKWLQIVGSFFAKHSEPIKISSSKDNLENKNGTIFLNILYVNVSPAAAVDFQHFKDKITEKINSYFGYQAITGIKIFQNFTPKLDENKKNNTIQKNNIINTDIKQNAKNIKNNDLKESIVKLGISINKEENDENN
tara:strand:- start:69 stop:596 length:528 start_codon:yes stop_codon:yes gene_type:complete